MVTESTTSDAAGAPESAGDDDPKAKAAAALAWLDTTLEELRGALTACGEAIDAGTLAPEVVSQRMNALVMEMMAGGS